MKNTYKLIWSDEAISNLKGIIDYLRDVGKAKEVHFRVGCPPILSPCFYGIDMSTITELVASKYIIC